MGYIFTRSRTDDSIVGGLIWQKSELIEHIMCVLVTLNFKMDRMKSNREKGESILYAQGQLTP